jgi:hypothetical protein
MSARNALDIKVSQQDDDDNSLLIEYLTLREVRIEQMIRLARLAAA